VYTRRDKMSEYKTKTKYSVTVVFSIWEDDEPDPINTYEKALKKARKLTENIPSPYIEVENYSVVQDKLNNHFKEVNK
jgi:hypothetical protein